MCISVKRALERDASESAKALRWAHVQKASRRSMCHENSEEEVTEDEFRDVGGGGGTGSIRGPKGRSKGF